MRAGREAGPGDGQRARRRGRCCRQPLGDQEPQQLACAPQGAGCSAAAGDSAGGWHGRRPVGHPAWGARGGVRWVYWGQSSPLSPSSPDLLPRIMTTQWPLVNGKEPYICVASLLLLHERKQRKEGNFSRISSQEMQGQNLNPGVQAPSLERRPDGNDNGAVLISWESVPCLNVHPPHTPPLRGWSKINL